MKKFAKIALGLVSICLAAACSSNDGVSQVHQALDPDDIVPPTTFTVRLRVQVPRQQAYNRMLCNFNGPSDQWVEGSDCSVCAGGLCEGHFPSDFTPDVFLGPAGAATDSYIWNVVAALGARINQANWTSQACQLPELYQNTTGAQYFGVQDLSGLDLPCAGPLSGTPGPDLDFGIAGQSLTRTFQIGKGTDQVDLVAALENVGDLSPAAVGSGFISQLSTGLSTAGNFVSAAAGTLQLTKEIGGLDDIGTLIGAIGAYAGFLANLLAIIPNMDPSTSNFAQNHCLGGILGNPRPGDVRPQDTFKVTFTGQQLYDGTQSGPMMVTLNARMNYKPPNGHFPDSLWCAASTDVSLIIDRGTPDNTHWTDGLAFEPRSADNAVVRRANAIESFRVDPIHNRVEHDSWQYSNSEANYHPADGLAACNGGYSCSPGDGAPGHAVYTEPTGNYVEGFADPNGQSPPQLTQSTTPVTALSPDPKQVAVFFVDDNGRLYISTGDYPSDDDTSDNAYWQTWLLATGLPARAPVAALRAARAGVNFGGPLYSVFWAGSDSAVHVAVVNGAYFGVADPSIPVSSAAISGAITSPGAAIAAVARVPGTGDVFVVGGAVWRLTGPPDSLAGWTANTVGPSNGIVSGISGITAVATTTTNMDLFYFDWNRSLQHAVWTNQPSPYQNNWANVPPPANTAGQLPLGLSAVARDPNKIDVVYPCSGAGLCDLFITANSFTGITQDVTPLIAPLPIGPTSPFSIVAASSLSLDLVVASGWTAYDLSWQRGSVSWATTGPTPTIDAIAVFESIVGF